MFKWRVEREMEGGDEKSSSKQERSRKVRNVKASWRDSGLGSFCFVVAFMKTRLALIFCMIAAGKYDPKKINKECFSC